MDNDFQSKLDKAADELLNKKSDFAGILVRGILPGSASERAGIQAGDTLIAVDGAPLLSLQDYVDASSKRGTSQVFDVLRGNQLLQIKVDWGN